MPRPKVADLEALLRALCAARVDYIVVGGAAAVILGSPTTTQVLDIVPAQTPENIERLHALLIELAALVRPVFVGRELRPTAALLAGAGQLNLSTNLGALDVLCRLHDGRGYVELVAHTEQIVDGDLTVRTLNLETLIAVKRAAGRPKDLLVVAILEQMAKGPAGDAT